MTRRSDPGIPTRDGERGMALGVVMVLLVVLLLAGGLAVWGVRSETGSAGSDRLGRQLFECAEQGLSWGKQYFTSTTNPTATNWNAFLRANLSLNLPRPPFPPLPGSGAAMTNYPDGPPFTTTIQIGGSTLEYKVAIYDNPDPPDLELQACGTAQDYYCDSDGQVVVWSRCRDTRSGQTRTVEALVQLKVAGNTDYNQEGVGFRGQGNRTGTF